MKLEKSFGHACAAMTTFFKLTGPQYF